MFENSPKFLWRPSETFSMSLTTFENHTNFLPSTVQFDWLISDQLLYSLNIYQFDRSALHFPFEFSSNKSTKFTSCFIFLFELLKIMKLMEKILKKAKEGFSWEIGALTGRPGDLMKSLETPGKTGRVGIYVSKADSCFCLAMQYRHINFPTDRKVDNIINSLHEESKPEILSFSLFQLYISVIYQQSNDLHLWPVTCDVYSVPAKFHVSS